VAGAGGRESRGETGSDFSRRGRARKRASGWAGEDACSNARRARAGRRAEEKKARWTGHARPKPTMNGGLAALGAFGHDSQQYRGRPPHAASRPSTFFSSALSAPFETVARRRSHAPVQLAAQADRAYGMNEATMCSLGPATNHRAESRVQSALHRRRMKRAHPPFTEHSACVAFHEKANRSMPAAKQ